MMRTTLRILAALALTASGAVGQEGLRLDRVYGDGESYLFGVLAGSGSGAGIAVLTDPEPALHRFTPGGVREWGGTGQGPAELRSPTDVVWRDSWIHVLDIGNRKVVRFDEDGEFSRTRSLEGLWANRLDIVGSDTILGVFTPMMDQRAVIRLAGSAVDTLLEYERTGRDHRLQAPNAPSLTVKPPFSKQIRWAFARDGTLFWYDPGADEIVRQDQGGVVLSRSSIPWQGRPLGPRDREWWIDNEIPSDFMGRRVFDPLRDVARRELEFPERLPPVLELESDPSGGVWAKRSLATDGELWTLLSAGKPELEFRLPPGRELLAVTESHVFALAVNDLEVETVEAYERPR